MPNAKFCVYIIQLIIMFSCMTSFRLYADERNEDAWTDLGLIEHEAIREASGIVASRRNSGVLWIHNDSDNPNCLYALDIKGRHLGIYYLEGIINRDWEDIAIGPGPKDDQDYLYLGDIGDNFSQYQLKYIYRFPEPIIDLDQTPFDKTKTITNIEQISFQYSDGLHDAETLLVDPLTTELYIISKWGNSVNVYLMPYPQSVTEVMILECVATLNIGLVVGGDISPCGSEILIKNYSDIYYFARNSDQSLWKAFDLDSYVTVPYAYENEPQGEAVCWDASSTGYYTVSEEPGGIPARLYFYPRFVSTTP
ncbi:TPA: hypothetical protein EYM82_15605 [Candidatus Poribacteria bacterium]|nr:hypothetical protein [Candidatus Poribacteria bacterium]HIO49486.1 hypothetical protein [Candidatus Poribacteria bacterium]